jgi:hypothetical protein
MITRFRSALHERVHDAKISRQQKKASAEMDGSFEEGCETSSGSDTDAGCEGETHSISDGSGIEFVIENVVDLKASPFYFYVCLGNEGETTRRKKRRGIKSSGVIHSRTPVLNADRATFLLPLSGLLKPEITVRFSRSMIVGADSFLGECHIKINLKTSVDGLDEHCVCRLIGGGNAFLSCRWKMVPYSDGVPRPTILPDESIVTDWDKLSALVDSVRKCLSTLSEDEDERAGQLSWVVSLCQLIETEELNFLLLRLPLNELLRVIPTFFHQIEAKLLNPALDVLTRARIIKAVQMFEDSQAETIISNLVINCSNDQIPGLKRLLNRGGDKNTLTSLLFSTIQSDLLREQIILKFQQAGLENPCIQIISEIDQVVHSPFGSIRHWPEGPIPGFKALFDALSKDVTFVSNKPLSFESWTHKLIRDLGLNDAPLLTGAKSDLYALRGGLSRLQSKVECTKYSNWSMYRRLFPEGRFVWFGESLDFARTLMQDENPKSGSQRFGVGKIILALVMGEEHSGQTGPISKSRGVWICKNFIQAAIACHMEGLLNEPTIIKELIFEFSKVVMKMEIDYARKGKRHRHLLKDQLVNVKMDLDRFREMTSSETDCSNPNRKDDLVDSLILTPIEALSPTLTNHSPSPDPDDPKIVQAVVENEAFVLNGL